MRSKFRRQHSADKKRVDDTKWRKPRGIDSKQRKKKEGKGKHPGAGFRGRKSERGAEEVLVRNEKELESVESNMKVKLSGKLGARKREQLIKIADEKGLTVVNRR
jgi:large subunit ribosomal protein L32e